MALLVYSTEFSQPLPDQTFRLLLGQLPAALQPRVLRFHRWQDAHANLLGKHLLRRGLGEIGNAPGLEALHYTPQAKPYFLPGPPFNISHSGNRVVCILSTRGPVGIDIEAITPLSFDDFQTQFRPNEWAAILSAPDPVAAFYRFWTAKESLIKADGRGLDIPLLELDVSEYRPIPLDGRTWNIRTLGTFPGYACHVATEDPDAEIIVREIPATSFSTIG